MSEYKPEIVKAADALMIQTSLFSCTLEVAWKKYMHPAITDNVAFSDVMNFINTKIELGKTYTQNDLI